MFQSRFSRFLIGLFALFCVFGCASVKYPTGAYLALERGRPGDVGVDAETLKGVDQIIEGAIADGKAPGAVLIIGKDNRIIYEKAYANRRVKPYVEPMTMDTIFDLASCSKILGTSAMTMLLIQDGDLRLDTKVADVLPQWEKYGKTDVTVWNLMTHTSGLPAYCNWKDADARREEGQSQADALIDYIASLKKIYPTGQYYVYSCLNYLTLARLNETVAGESMHSFLERRVWDPLEMTSSGYLLSEDQIARTAPTSVGDSTKGVGVVHDPLAKYYEATAERCPGNAGLFMSAGDMAVMAQLVLNQGMYNAVKVYEPETVQMWTTEQMVLNYYDKKKPDNKGSLNRRALGWINYLDEPYVTKIAPDGSFIGHTGWTGSYIWIDKHSKTFIVFNTNTVHPDGPPEIHPYRKEVTKVVLDSILEYRD